LVSCCLSAVGLGLLGHPAPAGELSLPHGRPTGHHVTGPQRDCRVAHEQTATGQGALFIPGTVVRSRPAITFRPAPAALPRPVPTAPLDHPIGGGHFHETSTRVHAIHPSPQARLATGPRPGTLPAGSRRSSPRPRPPDGTRAASASTPGFAPRSYPRRTPRRRQAITHWPGYYTLDISRTSKRCLPFDSSTLTLHVIARCLHHHRRHPGRAGPAAGEASPYRRSGRCRPAAPPRWRRRPGGTCWPPRTQRAESPRPARVPRAARLAGRGRIRGNPGAAAAAAAVVLWAAAAVSVTVITFTSSPPASAVTARTSGGAPAVASTPANMKGDPRDDRPLRNNGTVSGATWSFCRSRGGSRPTYSCVRYQVGREPGIGPAQLTCPNTDTDHSDQSVPVLFAPLFLKGRRGAGRGL